MEKKLPGVFANKIDKTLHNNERVYYSSVDKKESDGVEIKQPSIVKQNSKLELNINQKINNIFSSNKYVYKADVVIKTKEGEMTKKIIGQNKTHLITMDNELIPISDIVDIDFSI